MAVMHLLSLPQDGRKTLCSYVKSSNDVLWAERTLSRYALYACSMVEAVPLDPPDGSTVMVRNGTDVAYICVSWSLMAAFMLVLRSVID